MLHHTLGRSTRSAGLVWALLAALALPAGLVLGEDAKASPKTEEKKEGGKDSVLWEINNLEAIGGHKVRVEGAPKVVETERGKAIQFDGKSDGLFLDANPLEGLGAFTVEAFFRPDADGEREQRFVHIQEAGTDSRAMLETRVLENGKWYADTYLTSGRSSRALADPKLLHPCGQWQTLALVYDGKQMIQYVNGVKELTGAVAFKPLDKGATSLGVRQNKVCWFKGALLKLRITPRALAADELLRP